MNSSDHYGTIEIESFTDSDNSLKSDNKTKAENAICPLNAKNAASENGSNESELETSKGERKQTRLQREVVNKGLYILVKSKPYTFWLKAQNIAL